MVELLPSEGASERERPNAAQKVASESEALTVGVPDEDGHPVLVTPDEDVPLGGALY